jgi:hypothetical protein
MGEAYVPLAVIETPSILGLKPTGVEELPDALLRQGLARRLGARTQVESSLGPIGPIATFKRGC